MWSKQFFKLAQHVGIHRSAAAKLWDVLSHAENLPSVSDGNRQRADASGLTEDMFVQHLLRWTPNEALDTLRKEVVARFPSFVDVRKALRRQGFPGSVVLSPRRFRKGLREIGVLQADTDVVLSKVRAMRCRQNQRLKTKGIIDDATGDADWEEVTLDEVFEYMNSSIFSDSASNIIE